MLSAFHHKRCVVLVVFSDGTCVGLDGASAIVTASATSEAVHTSKDWVLRDDDSWQMSFGLNGSDKRVVLFVFPFAFENSTACAAVGKDS